MACAVVAFKKPKLVKTLVLVGALCAIVGAVCLRVAFYSVGITFYSIY